MEQRSALTIDLRCWRRSVAPAMAALLYVNAPAMVLGCLASWRGQALAAQSPLAQWLTSVADSASVVCAGYLTFVVYPGAVALIVRACRSQTELKPHRALLSVLRNREVAVWTLTYLGTVVVVCMGALCVFAALFVVTAALKDGALGTGPALAPLVAVLRHTGSVCIWSLLVLPIAWLVIGFRGLGLVIVGGLSGTAAITHVVRSLRTQPVRVVVESVGLLVVPFTLCAILGLVMRQWSEKGIGVRVALALLSYVWVGVCAPLAGTGLLMACPTERAGGAS